MVSQTSRPTELVAESDPPQGWKKWFGIVFGYLLIAGFTIGGIAFLVEGITKARRGMNASSRFVRTPGEIISTEIHTYRGNNKSTYEPRTSYRYEALGVQRVGTRVRAVGNEGSKQWAQDIIKQYPVGAKVDVYYDPDNPDESVLDPTTSLGDLGELALLALVSVVFFLPAGFQAYGYVKKRRATANKPTHA